MPDHEVLQKVNTDPPKQHSKRRKDKLSEKDDLAGMFANAAKSINYQELIFIWILFIILHSEPFIVKLLSKIQGTVDEKNNMTMYGTGVISVLMVLGIWIISIIFN